LEGNYMALRKTFHSTSVLDNPCKEEVPGVRSLLVQFPVEDLDERQIKQMSRKLLWLSYLSCWLGTLSFITASPAENAVWAAFEQAFITNVHQTWFYGGAIAVSVAGSHLDPRRSRIETPRTTRWKRILILEAVYLSAIVLKYGWADLLAGLGLLVLLRHALMFRRHFQHVSSGGMLDPKNRESFRRRGRVSFPLKRRNPFRAFREAWRSWASYNANGKRHPSFIQSPSGSLSWRAAQTFIAAFLTGHIAAYKPLELAGIFLPPALVGQGFIWVAAGGALLLGALAVVPFALYQLTLFTLSLPILSAALFLKETAYSPERSDGFLDSLEFTKYGTRTSCQT
jgi:hypothetical protein